MYISNVCVCVHESARESLYVILVCCGSESLFGIKAILWRNLRVQNAVFVDVLFFGLCHFVYAAEPCVICTDAIYLYTDVCVCVHQNGQTKRWDVAVKFNFDIAPRVPSAQVKGKRRV